MTFDGPTTALLVGTICSAGIAVNLGFMGFASAAYELITGRGQAEVVASRLHFPFRLIESFSRERWVGAMVGTSLVFVVAAVLDLTYAEGGWPPLSWSVGASILGLLMTGAIWTFLVGSSALMTPTEASTIHDGIVRGIIGNGEASPVKSKRAPRKRRQ